MRHISIVRRVGARIVLLLAVTGWVVASMSGGVGAFGAASGPAPNAGDGVSDGSGLDAPFGVRQGRGPAPNSGDGIPDGSGF